MAHSLSPLFEKRRKAAVAIIKISSVPIFCKLKLPFLKISLKKLPNGKFRRKEIVGSLLPSLPVCSSSLLRILSAVSSASHGGADACVYSSRKSSLRRVPL